MLCSLRAGLTCSENICIVTVQAHAMRGRYVVYLFHCFNARLVRYVMYMFVTLVRFPSAHL